MGRPDDAADAEGGPVALEELRCAPPVGPRASPPPSSALPATALPPEPGGEGPALGWKAGEAPRAEPGQGEGPQVERGLSTSVSVFPPSATFSCSCSCSFRGLPRGAGAGSDPVRGRATPPRPPPPRPLRDPRAGRPAGGEQREAEADDALRALLVPPRPQTGARSASGWGS